MYSRSAVRHPPAENPNYHRGPAPYRQNVKRPQFFSQPRDRYRPPENYRDRPNFVVQLRSDGGDRCVKQAEIGRKLKFGPQRWNFVDSGNLLVELSYEQWSEALVTMVQLWELKLFEDECNFLPTIVCNVGVPSDKVELNERLKTLFLDKLNGLVAGDLVQSWLKKLRSVVDEVKRVSFMLGKPNKCGVFEELLRQKKGMEAERDLILKRVQEFKSGIRCIVNILENGEKNEEGVVPIYSFSNSVVDWERIYRLIMREIRRLDDGLPIYAHRRDILKQIHSQQIMVLIGETGSGKSTQLVQFLADSGICGKDSIVCTQPRRLAAVSLKERVKEECLGCYKDTSFDCFRSYSSDQKFDASVIFMTDLCLLQHYMSDKELSNISCIIVDEAHERTLNTDILLALLKNLLCKRPDLRLIIMSATVDANQFSGYFFGCNTFHVPGRNFPVDIKYVPCGTEGVSGSMPSYVLDVMKTVTEINKSEKDGTILAFLTSQMEVHWACDKFEGSSAIALPLHGKLSLEDQRSVFLAYPGKRKVIFSTNVAETSLTIPGVKYVVDPGMVKESKFEPATGMNVLRVCRISQSSANQRCGRAGRTEPGTCYRLYSEHEFESMMPHQEPEIRKVHLGIAVLRILALGIKDVQGFDFVDAPSERAIDMAIRNLIHLGAVAIKDDMYVLTSEGWEMVKLGTEPRLGKVILQCLRHRLPKEGVVLAAVMANSGNIFRRVGTEDDKSKSDCIKMKFSHPNGDLFTFLAVYKEWDSVVKEKKNEWCWTNHIYPKSMWRCHETVKELEDCLYKELNRVVSNFWRWDPKVCTDYDTTLKNIILSSLPENVAMYSGYDQLGYEVALSGKYVQLHLSCSLLNFGQRPPWVVFSEILSVHDNEYLVGVAACDLEHLSKLAPPPPYNFLDMESRRLEKRTLMGLGSFILKRFCGRFNGNVRQLVASIRASCGDERIGVDVSVDQNEILIWASSVDMEKVCGMVNDALEYEKNMMRNECFEKGLYDGGPSTLFGAGAEVRHLELEKRPLSVEILHPNVGSLNDKELILVLEKFTSGNVCHVNKFPNTEGKWGRVTFTAPEAVKKAIDLDHDFGGGSLKVVPHRNIGDHKSFPSFRAKISWPRKESTGVGIVKCDPRDVEQMVHDFSDLVGRGSVRCTPNQNNVRLEGLDKELSEADLRDVLTGLAQRQILDFFLVRRKIAVNHPPPEACEAAIRRVISPFMPRRNLQGSCVRVEVFRPGPEDYFMRAEITFDGTLHLEAARALEQLNGKVLPECLAWQKIQCEHVFHSLLFCPAPVYAVTKNQLASLISKLQRQKGVKCLLEENQICSCRGSCRGSCRASCRIRIIANATKIVAELRKPIEQLIEGKILQHPDMTGAVLQNLFSRDGISLMNSIQGKTGAHIYFDKRSTNVRIFGSPEQIEEAHQNLVQSLLTLHGSKQLEIQLRGGSLPPDMMKRVVDNFGPDLRGLEELVPEAEFKLSTRRHTISVIGAKELKQKVEGIVYDLARRNELPIQSNDNDSACPICLCEVEDSYRLEGCYHEFCRACLVDQCDSAIRNPDSFPLQCTKQACGAHILVSDLRFLLPDEKLKELFKASVGAFVSTSSGSYRFCPTPDCPSVYKVGPPSGRTAGAGFVCGACLVETCTSCHLEYHPFMSCEMYREFKDDPDHSLKEWCMGKDNVKMCPVCGFTIEKIEGCNHIECRCGKHVCWVCLECYESSNDCYDHLRSVHLAIM